MVKMKNNIVIPLIHIFHGRFADEIYSRQKLGDNVSFDRQNNYHKGDFSSGSIYFGETKPNTKVRWNEHNEPTKSSEPSKHIQSNIKAISLQMLQKLLRRVRMQKHYILRSTDLKELKDFERLVLFINDFLQSNQ